MTKRKNDGYLDAIQERMDGDVFRAMLEVMAQRVMEDLALHLAARGKSTTRLRPVLFADVFVAKFRKRHRFSLTFAP